MKKRLLILLTIVSFFVSGLIYYLYAHPSLPPAIIEPGSMVTEADYIIFTDGINTYARNGKTGKIEFGGSDARTVIQNAINAISSGKIIIKGDYEISNQINLKSNINIELSGSLTLGGSGEKFIFYGENIENVAINGKNGKLLSTWEDGFPIRIRGGENIWIEDLIIDHTMFVWNVKNVFIKNIIQLGRHGASGHDYGINMGGENITVDGFFANLNSAYQGGFVINYPYNNIVLENISAIGNFGSFVHFYIPIRDDTQLHGGKVTVKDFYVKYTEPPNWGHFGTFVLLEEFSPGTKYGGDYGELTIENGKIIGPNQTMIGGNGIGVISLLSHEVNVNVATTVKVNINNIVIEGMRSSADKDYIIYLLRGYANISGLYYKGNWDTYLFNNCSNFYSKVEDGFFSIGSHTLYTYGGESLTGGTLYALNDKVYTDLTVVR